MEYIKVIFKDDVYGPIRAPTTLAIVCNALKITMRSQPYLEKVCSESESANGENDIRECDLAIFGGLYKLIQILPLEYDESIDGPYVLIKTHPVKLPIRQTLEIEIQSQRVSSKASTLPLSEDEMAECLRAMMHLIQSIPARYVKYNKVLAAQIDNALVEVDKLQASLIAYQSHLSLSEAISVGEEKTKKNASHSRFQELPLGIHITFTQYRIVHILYETWKTAWRRFAPDLRTVHVSKVLSLHAFDLAEQYLNRLWSWRRILDHDQWAKLQSEQSHQALQEQVYSKRGVQLVTAKDRLLQPPQLSSGNHPRAWEYVVQPMSNVESLLNAETPRYVSIDSGLVLKELRPVFIEAMLQNQIYQDQELEFLLQELISLDKSSRLSKQTLDKGNELVYPARIVRETLRKEFRIQLDAVPTSGLTDKSRISNIAKRFIKV